MAKNEKLHPTAVQCFKGLNAEIVPIKRQLHKLSQRYRTLANAADRKACDYKRRYMETGHKENAIGTDEESVWLLRFHDAYAYASEVYSDISKALSVSINNGSVHFDRLPTHPNQIDAAARIEDLKTAYANYQIVKRHTR